MNEYILALLAIEKVRQQMRDSLSTDNKNHDVKAKTSKKH